MANELPSTGMTAGVARKTACSTERPVWHARLRAPREDPVRQAPWGGHAGPPLRM